MKHWGLLAMAAIFTLSVVGVDDADARRFGGGASFGKQRMHTPTHNSFSQRSTAPKKSATANSQRGSARTGMMGMLGGLALGGLLGAMFFGGAFEGINLFDIVIIGAMIAILVWFLRRKAESQMAYAGAQGNQAGFTHAMQATGKMLRPDINEKHFLQAARDIFMRMQTAWDAKNIDDIRKFCTPEIADRIEQDMRVEERNHTEVVTVDAALADSWIESDMEWVAVNFSAMMRETTQDKQGHTTHDERHEVHETWIFQHRPNSDDPTWYLAGIQQQG